MEETVKEKILQNVKTTLEGIKKENGYNFDFIQSGIQRWSMFGNKMTELPMAIISPGNEEERSSPDPYEECALTVYLDIFYVNDEKEDTPTDTYLNRLQGDVKKAILADHTRGSNAIDTNVMGTTPFETTEGQHYAGIIIELEIKYQHLRLDPTAPA